MWKVFDLLVEVFWIWCSPNIYWIYFNRDEYDLVIFGGKLPYIFLWMFLDKMTLLTVLKCFKEKEFLFLKYIWSWWKFLRYRWNDVSFWDFGSNTVLCFLLWETVRIYYYVYSFHHYYFRFSSKNIWILIFKIILSSLWCFLTQLHFICIYINCYFNIKPKINKL